MSSWEQAVAARAGSALVPVRASRRIRACGGLAGAACCSGLGSRKEGRLVMATAVGATGDAASGLWGRCLALLLRQALRSIPHGRSCRLEELPSTHYQRSSAAAG